MLDMSAHLREKKGKIVDLPSIIFQNLIYILLLHAKQAICSACNLNYAVIVKNFFRISSKVPEINSEYEKKY